MSEAAGEGRGASMSDRTRLGLAVAEAALIVGLLGDMLLRATPWGLNVALWTAALVAGAHVLSRRRGARTLGGEGAWLWPVALLFAGFFVWRDSAVLRLLDALVVLAVLSLASWAARGARVRLAGITHYVAAAATAAFHAAAGFFPLLFADIKWQEVPRTGWSKHALAAARGLLIAAPLLLLFGALLVAADALFEGLVKDVFSFDAGTALSHVILFGLLSWVAAGYLRGLVLGGAAGFGAPAFTTLDLKQTPAAAPEKTAEGGGGDDDARAAGGPDISAEASEAERHIAASARGGYRFSDGEEGGRADEARAGDKADGPKTGAENASAKSGATAAAPAATQAAAAPSLPSLSLGIVEVGIVLGLIDLLFLSFVAVQTRYLFGDAQHVIQSAGLTFSDYARRGFFELVWVALLALPMLLAAHWLLRKQGTAAQRVFRGLAGVMVALLFAVMASGLWRMRLYQLAYGQTELRLYTTAFMLWLGLVFVWFALTVLRGRRERFACGGLVLWLVALAALHFVNPDDTIVRSNVAQARTLSRPERFDSEYALSISADAVPALVELLPEMSPRDRASVASRLTSWLDPKRTGDWRSWNFARSRAARVVAANADVLREYEARWRAELKLEHTKDAPPPPPAARWKTEAALAVLPGTFSVRVERRPVENEPSYGWHARTASLISGGTTVSVVALGNDNGTATRVTLHRLSPTVYLLGGSGGAYAADLTRRLFVHQPGAEASGTYVGSFDLDAQGVWRFIPASEKN